MADPENLSKFCGIRESYLRNITNAENEILQVISNFDSKNENLKLKLLAKKISLSEKKWKIKNSRRKYYRFTQRRSQGNGTLLIFIKKQ